MQQTDLALPLSVQALRLLPAPQLEGLGDNVGKQRKAKKSSDGWLPSFVSHVKVFNYCVTPQVSFF